jgi:hypothetical protein
VALACWQRELDALDDRVFSICERRSPTRAPAFYNDTYEYLTGLGMAEV